MLNVIYVLCFSFWKEKYRKSKYFQVLKNVTLSYYKIKNFFTLYSKN